MKFHGAALLLFVGIPATFAFPNQAGHCLSGPVLGEASEGLHGEGGGSSLETVGLALSLDGDVLDPSIVAAINIGNTYTLTLSGTFKGFLFRLSDKNGASVKNILAVTDTINTQDCPPCLLFDDDSLSGVCHTNNAIKDRVSVDFGIASSSDLLLEMTVVVDNTGASDNWYYSNYTLTSSTEAPTLAPSTAKIPTLPPTAAANGTVAPTLAPSIAKIPTLPPTAAANGTVAPTLAPSIVKTPTLPPTAASVNTTLSPTTASITDVPVTSSPTLSPTQNPTPKYSTPAPSPSPTSTPTNAPSPSPTNAPSPSPSDAPSVSPTSSPSTTPTSAPSAEPTHLTEYIIIADSPNRGGNDECLELRRGQTYEENKFLGKTCDPKRISQRFLVGFNDDNDVFLLRPKIDLSMCTEVYEAREKAWLHIATCAGRSTQLWKFNLDHYTGDGYYAISPIDNDNFVVTNHGINIDNGDPAMLRTFEQTFDFNAIQKWKFMPVD